MSKPGLFICVDADGFDGVSVYPANEATEDAGFATTRVFSVEGCGSLSAAKRDAEDYARRQAAKIDSDWGCNY